MWLTQLRSESFCLSEALPQLSRIWCWGSLHIVTVSHTLFWHVMQYYNFKYLRIVCFEHNKVLIWTQSGKVTQYVNNFRKYKRFN